MTDQRDELITTIIGCAIAVHDELGPGLLESPYRCCLAEEFRYRRVSFVSELALPLTYRSVRVECAYRVDFVVEDRIVLEIKAVDRIVPIHQAQLITYLKLLKLQRGLILNFNVPLLKNGVRSISLR